MCKDLLNVEHSPEDAEDSDALGEGLTSPHSAQGSVDSSFARGHFYTNDVKVCALYYYCLYYEYF